MSNHKKADINFARSTCNFTFTTKITPVKVFIFGTLSHPKRVYSDCGMCSCYIKPLPYKAIGNIFESRT
jgi:hypothetical protein